MLRSVYKFLNPLNRPTVLHIFFGYVHSLRPVQLFFSKYWFSLLWAELPRNHGSIPAGVKRFFSSLQCLDRLCGPPLPPIQRVRRAMHPGVKRSAPLVPMLRIRGAVPPFPVHRKCCAFKHTNMSYSRFLWYACNSTDFINLLICSFSNAVIKLIE
jgi:hypothetical protein